MAAARNLVVVAIGTLSLEANAAPCFGDQKAPLVAAQIYRDLETHAVAIGWSQPTPPPETYGTCTVEDGKLRDRDGKHLADLACGITVFAKGIADARGFQVGAAGSDVAKAHAKDTAVCRIEAKGLVRCWFEESEGLVPEHYIFKGTLPGATLQKPARGKRARTFVRIHRVNQVVQRMNCH
jgi:hypothetical protein